MGFESVLSLEKVLGKIKYSYGEKQWDDKTKLRQLPLEGGRGILPGRCTEGT